MNRTMLMACRTLLLYPDRLAAVCMTLSNIEKNDPLHAVWSDYRDYLKDHIENAKQDMAEHKKQARK